jgi:hypothetical protein
MEDLFRLSNLLVAPFWLLMIGLPRWRVTKRLLRSHLAVLGPALLYAALMLPRLAEHAPTLLRPELEAIAALLGSPVGATIGWTHFLAFDLFVGRWIYTDARARGVGAWVTSPVLFLTLLVGPVGLLLHLCVRRLFGRADETNTAPAAAHLER